MPALSMFPDTVPQMATIVVETQQWPEVTHPDEMVVTAKISLVGKVVPAVMVWTLAGLQRDFYQTLVEEVHSAWRWGEQPKDVWRAGNGVLKMAKAHARAHEM